MSLFLSRTARRRLGLGEAFGIGGRIGLPTFFQARVLALELVTRAGDLARGVSAGRLNALSELERLFREIALELLSIDDPDRLRGLFRVLIERFGSAAVDRLLCDFAREFLAFELEPGWTERLDAAGGETVLRQAGEVLRELLILAWVHRIPEAAGVQEVLHEGPVVEAPIFEAVTEVVEEWVEPAASERAASPIAVVEAVAAAPSLRDQLKRAVEGWPELSPAPSPGFVAALDLIEEEERPRFAPGGAGPPIELPGYAHLEDAPALFSTDEPWMAGVAILAKNTFVWLDQIGRRLGRPVRRLDEIPDDELEAMAADGVDTLWMIGVWERSPASQRVKRLCGNPDAEASAYSLRAYRVAPELGGEAALAALERRAKRHGIRLGADMVPNHLGIDSDWMYDHPERFLSVPVPPYPTYTFDGPDLSERSGIEVRIEDHYYDRSDAAVVFERRDRKLGTARYVYHGNDGTTTPWNDTAQLDYSSARVRTAVIEEILKVAKLFPVVRFDAAMTLAKKHVQRLWFPLPGDAGAIPSRSEHAMTQEHFDALMPEEFWREVVARVVSERPGTMILAEAFWLMESYFVRSLGVHRVYNSAFMNLLREGRDRKYRDLLKETLKFDSRILERYVNFMTNPDEASAREQFGAGDRYFGVATLLATLPGTPLFGHGQFVGFEEKYGMEFRRARRDEPVSEALVAEHRRRIGPLLADRRLFAGAEHFRLFDCTTGSGVAESVYAYTNRRGERRAIVLFNHGPRPVVGRLAASAPARPDGRGEARSELIVEALDLGGAADEYWLFRDRVTGDGFLRSRATLEREGLEVSLGPFESRVLGDFHNVGRDRDGSLAALARGPGRRGAIEVEARVLLPRAVPVARNLRELVRRERLAQLLDEELTSGGADAAAWSDELAALRQRLVEVGFLTPSPPRLPATEAGPALLDAMRGLRSFFRDLPWPESERLIAARERWLSEGTTERLVRLTAWHVLAEVARWGDGARRFLDLVEARRAVAGDEQWVVDAGWLRAGPPPGIAAYSSLVAAAERAQVPLDDFVWWRIAGATSAWSDPLREARGDRRWRRRWGAEAPADAVVGWVDAVERLREERPELRTG